MLGLFSAYVFLGARQRALVRQGSLILAYHKIGVPPRGTGDPYLYVSTSAFDRQLGALRGAGLASSRLDDFPPANAAPGFVVTFDDGSVTVMQNALEALARHKVRAIQFILPGLLGGQNTWDIAKGDQPDRLMDDGQVREWLAAGHEIGSHSISHRNLRHLSPAEAREEIAASRKALEDRFGVAVRHFSYPYGSSNAVVRDLVAEAGYATACGMAFGVNPPGTPRLELRRIIPLSSRELLGKILHRLGRKFGNHRPSDQ
jgi:peptidoglycan/xylan/chitin deacetylase (PgdA/CDA1 family)